MAANRRFTSQFSQSQERQPVKLMSVFTQTTLGTLAALTNQGVTYTAKRYSPIGNSITIALINPLANNQTLTITVVGDAISASLATGAGGLITTTAAQLITALNADTAASALITATGSGGTALTALAATPLAGGVATVFSQIDSRAGMTLVQLSAGTYEIQLSDSYAALLAPSIKIQRATAVDLNPQMVSAVTQSKSVIFRMLATATPTNMANADQLIIGLTLRNSANASGPI